MVNALAQFIRQSGAIALVTLRQAVHSRAAFWMLVASVTAAAGLPMVLRGDGTPGSTLRLAMTYPPALLFIMLLSGTVWMAAASMAQEIEGGEMASVMTRPVNTSVIGLGKWLGILLLNAGLIATFAAFFIPAMSIIANREQDETSLSRLGGHQEFHPIEDDYRQEAGERLSVLRLSDASVDDFPFERMLNVVKAEAFRVAPDQTYTWRIPLPRPDIHHRRGNRPVWDLQFLFRCDPLTRTAVNGAWILTLPENPAALTVPVAQRLDGQHQITLPPLTSLHHGFATVTFSNRQDSSTVYFDPRSPVALRLQESTFHENLFRALFSLFCFIAATAALAITMGVLFSFPVAVFTVLALFSAVAVSAAFAVLPPPDHVHGEAVANGYLGHLGEFLLFHINRAASSTLQLLPLASLPDARHITNRQLALASARLLAGLPMVLCAFSAFLLRRKEYS